jgi:LysR family glycine cleavage system transcriptional activator
MPEAPPQPLPPLAAIRAFEAAARHRSFTRAGDELGMTQAAVSYQIRQLEDRVGMPLFRRRPRGVVLTADGARLAERAGEALEILRQAFAEARHQGDETLVISALATFAAHLLAPRLGHFQIAHPEITTRVEVDHRLADLLAGEASVAIRGGLGQWPGLRADLLMRVDYTPMLSAAFIARRGRPETPADVRDLPLIDPDDPGWAQWFAAAGVAAPEPAGRARSYLGTQLLAAQAVLAGQGVGLLTPVYFLDQLARGELIQPFDILGVDEISIWLVYPERRRNAPAIRAFRAWLLGEMRNLGVGGGPTEEGVRSSSS